MPTHPPSSLACAGGSSPVPGNRQPLPRGHFASLRGAGNLTPMHRIRILVAALAVFAVLGAPPAFAQSEDTGGEGPAVVIEEDSGAVEEDAWTFRYLVPTLLLLTGVGVVAVVVGYGVRVRGRYRVVE